MGGGVVGEDRDPVASGERPNATNVVDVLVGDNNRVERPGFHVDEGQPPGQLFQGEARVDEYGRGPRTDKGRVSIGPTGQYTDLDNFLLVNSFLLPRLYTRAVIVNAIDVMNSHFGPPPLVAPPSRRHPADKDAGKVPALLLKCATLLSPSGSGEAPNFRSRGGRSRWSAAGIRRRVLTVGRGGRPVTVFGGSIAVVAVVVVVIAVAVPRVVPIVVVIAAALERQ